MISNWILALASVFLPVIGSVVWFVRLEGRVNTIEEVNKLRHEDLKTFINTRFDAQGERLSRIERALNGALKKE